MCYSNNKGYTLIELMIAIVIGLILISAASVTYVAQNRSYVAQDSVSEVNTQSKIAHDLILDDIRSAGFGAPGDMDVMPVNGLTSVITAVDSDVTPDAITIVSGFSVIGHLQCKMEPFNTNLCGQDSDTITLSDTSGLVAGDVLSIDGIETALIQSISGANVTLDRRLIAPYDAGRPVYHVQDVTYSVDGSMGLWKEAEAIADSIEDLQFAYAVDADGDGDIDDQNADNAFGPEDFIDSPADFSSIRAIRVNILARTEKGDVNYESQGNPPASIENRVHGPTGDDFRRRWWQSMVTLRNP